MAKKFGKVAVTILKHYLLFNGACWAFIGIGMWFNKVCDGAVWDVDAGLTEFLEESCSG